MAPSCDRARRAAPRAARSRRADKALEKLGLVRDIDLALHLPLRYEDETRLIADRRRCATARPAQVEGVVSDCAGRSSGRAASSSSRIDDEQRRRWCCASCTSIRRSRRRSRAGKRVRARGEARGGFFGREMVHPSFKVVDAGAPLADRADAGLPEHGAAVAGVSAQGGRRRRWRAPTSTRSLPPALLPPDLPTPARRACACCTSPPPGRRRRGARGPQRIRPGSASSSTSCWRSSCRSCRPSASASAQRAPAFAARPRRPARRAARRAAVSR